MTSQAEGSKSPYSASQRLQRSQLVEQISELVDRARIYQTCLTCTNFDEATEICSLAKVRPPARVIAQGCSAYNEVPPF